MTDNDHDLYTAGLPVSFSSTKVNKRRKPKKQKSAQKKQAKQQRCAPDAENLAEEFGVLEVLARYRKPFTILMDPEERLARAEDDKFEASIELDYGMDEGAVEAVEDEHVDDDIVETVSEDEDGVECALSQKENTDDNAKDFSSHPTTSTTINDEPSLLHKYYQQKYDYFSLFDEGIQIDHEGWYSVTPEAIAAHTAHELFSIAQVEGEESVVLDAFCGVGGNAIQFAQVFDKVIAVDLSPARLEMARHNATVYGVADKIEFIGGDAFEILKNGVKGHKISAIFLSPPWGGPEYCAKETFHPRDDLFAGRGSELLKAARSQSRNCVFFMPRQTDIYAFAEMMQEVEGAQLKESDSFVVERHFLRRRLKAISIYLY